jgi:hypothetical protein
VVWQALERGAREDRRLAELFAEGLAQRWSPLLASGTAQHLEEDLLLLERVRGRLPGLGDAAARGFGLCAGRLARREIPLEGRLIEAAFARLAEPDVEPFLFGLGMGLADGRERPAIPERVATWVAPEQRDTVLAGLAARLVELDGESAAAERLRSARRPAGW